MRGLGDFQRAQMRDADPRVAELFRNLRQALDVFEEIMLRPYRGKAEEQKRESASAAAPAAPTTMPPQEQKLAYTVNEVRKLVGISNATLYKVLGRGELKAVKVGSRTLILARDLQEWLGKLSRSH